MASDGLAEAGARPHFCPPAREEITSVRNALVQLARHLGESRRERESHGLAVLEGVRLAEEADAAGVAVEWFFYTRTVLERERGLRAVTALSRRARGFLVSAAVMERAAQTESPQGILATFRPPSWGPDQLGPGLVLVADGLQDPGNIGTLVRSAAALGAAGLCLAGGADPWSPKVVRAAMGSLFRLPVLRVAAAGELLSLLRQRGYRVLLADAAGGMPPWQAALTGRVALVVGSEAAGPSAAARRLATEVVAVPMQLGTESLNAAAAAAMLLYEALRQRQAAEGAGALPVAASDAGKARQ